MDSVLSALHSLSRQILKFGSIKSRILCDLSILVNFLKTCSFDCSFFYILFQQPLCESQSMVRVAGHWQWEGIRARIVCAVSCGSILVRSHKEDYLDWRSSCATTGMPIDYLFSFYWPRFYLRIYLSTWSRSIWSMPTSHPSHASSSLRSMGPLSNKGALYCVPLYVLLYPLFELSLTKTFNGGLSPCRPLLPYMDSLAGQSISICYPYCMDLVPRHRRRV